MSQNEPMTDQREALEQIERGFPRSTATRRAVMGAIADWHGHFSAEEVARAVPGVSRATVYRTLAHLQEAGVVCRVPVDGGGLRYRLGEARHHHHLVCLGCGDVQDITGCGVDEFVRSIAARFDYQPVDHRLEVYGRCAACRRGPNT